jgi:hypothetical protein
MQQGEVLPDGRGRSSVFCKNLTWTPTKADAGQHIVCAIVEDDTRYRLNRLLDIIMQDFMYSVVEPPTRLFRSSVS